MRHINFKGFSCMYIYEALVRILYWTSCKVRNDWFKKLILLLVSWENHGFAKRNDAWSLPIQRPFLWEIYKTKEYKKTWTPKRVDYVLCFMWGATIVTTVHRRSQRVLGMGLLTVKNDSVQDSFILEGESNPTEQYVEKEVINDNNNKN